ncbi:hypothetical protein ADK53_33480 [Streptomyces sp. WM6373]|uniref:hypothetical protein n=1 Tax=unclassified Streptomyces TaxID=2593676 RepID=UPI0006AE4BA9|nr:MULTISPECIES: hypothetical protein [unclassified Streptomyces]KOU28932.1 hypothetical protein ADK53_33480 [Streptomyces sp. WM6373]KOU73796.1 hypothetical protein ADK61_21080 [Streptomyces sp. XY66]
MEAALIIFALMLLAIVGLGAYLTVKAVGAAKRGVERTVAQARRSVEDTTLRAKSFGQVGVAGALAQLRLDLRTSMRATQQALAEGAQADASLRESLGLFERLSAHGHELDGELKRLEQEPDRQRTAELLPDLRERAAKIIQAADSLRWAARDRARRFAEDDLSLLSDQIQMESGALRDWSREPVDDLAAAAAEWDAAQSAQSAQSGQSAPSPEPEPTPRPAALNPPAPTVQYPWQQKTPRPESAG